MSNFSKTQTDLTEALTQLKSGDFQNRWDIAKLILSFGEEAIAPLIRLLELELVESEATDDWELLWFIARMLGNWNHADAIAALVRLIRTTHYEEVAGMAATALASLGPSAIPPLCQLLNEPTTYRLAVEALAQIHHPDIVPPLLAAMQDASPTLRTAAIEAIGHFQQAQISETLLQALQDPASSVRRAAVVALGLQADLHDPSQLVAQLQPLLWDINIEVCQQTAVALSRIKTQEATASLFEVLCSPAAALALKVEIARALTWIETPVALDSLQEFLAIVAQMQATPQADQFLEHSKNVSFQQILLVCQEVVVALGRVESEVAKKKATDLLIKLLQTEHPITQEEPGKQAIALSLGQLKQSQALQPLVHLLADDSARVRFHVIAALKQLESQGAYQTLQTLATHTELNKALKQGIAIALQEWTS